ncbi:MAG: hypothetical protein QME51_00685 [Planctomycetota bacterium]|nr:hypothetical protein [Planctomycetota bacterium]MDI6786874.1 hypothetical protein [Planctomycetota bacterium]
MPNIVECPICDTRYDIGSLKDGMKLKCTRCHKIVGTIKEGSLLPLLESIKTEEIKPSAPPPPSPLAPEEATQLLQPAPPPQKPGAPKPYMEILEVADGDVVGFEEVVIHKMVRRGEAYKVYEKLELLDPDVIVEKPPLMLVLAGVTGLAAVITVSYILFVLYQPQKIFRAPIKTQDTTTTSPANIPPSNE